MAVKKIGAVLLALVLAAPCTVPAVCMADTDTLAEEGQDDASADGSEGLKVTVETYKKEFKTAQGVVYKEISFEYPVAQGSGEAAEAFNKFYKNLRTKWLRSAKEDLKDAKDIVVSLREGEDYYSDDVTCLVTSSDENYISVLQSGYVYELGAHGIPYRYAYIFDAKTGKKVSAANLLGITKAKLNQKVYSLFLKKFDNTKDDAESLFYEDRSQVKEAVEEIDFNNNCYYLKNGKIRFYADPYVAGPYASGFIEVAVKI